MNHPPQKSSGDEPNICHRILSRCGPVQLIDSFRHTNRMSCFLLVCISVAVGQSLAFMPSTNTRIRISSSSSSPSSTTSLFALTERKMQFWEDVEDGLDDIENFYAKNGLGFDRIRQFGIR
jgi:hypothetical protein